MTRKMLSVTTFGAVDFRSDRERTASYARGVLGEAKSQTKIMRKAARRQRAATRQPVGELFRECNEQAQANITAKREAQGKDPALTWREVATAPPRKFGWVERMNDKINSYSDSLKQPK